MLAMRVAKQNCSKRSMLRPGRELTSPSYSKSQSGPAVNLQQVDDECLRLSSESQLISAIAAPPAESSLLVINHIRHSGLQHGVRSSDSGRGWPYGSDLELVTFLQLIRSTTTESSQNQVSTLSVSLIDRQFHEIPRLPEPVESMEPAKNLSSYRLN